MPLFKEIEHTAITDVGWKRSHNQDACTVQRAPDREHWQRVGHLFIVADGMGGHAVGEMASAKAIQEIPLIYVKQVKEAGPVAALRLAFQQANTDINTIGASNPEFRGLGTTATALVLRNEGAWVAHVGDSRAYRVRGNQIQQLTYDHSFAWEMARRHGIPPEEFGDIKKNVIVRSLGPDTEVQVDVEGPYPLESGDTFILCSDGLSNLVNPDEIGVIVSVLSTEEAGRLLVEIANLRGGPDNITVIVVRVGSSKDSVIAPLVKKPSRVLALLKKAALGWNKRIPWPITILMVGFLMALFFVFIIANAWPGAWAMFFLSALTIAIGMGGLFYHAKQTQNQVVEEPEEPTRASIHRQYPVRIDSALVDRWVTTTMQLKEQVEAREWTVDWQGYKKLVDAGLKASHHQDWLAAFRYHLQALSRLASTYNRQRPKEESFQPKW